MAIDLTTQRIEIIYIIKMRESLDVRGCTDVGGADHEACHVRRNVETVATQLSVRTAHWRCAIVRYVHRRSRENRLGINN